MKKSVLAICMVMALGLTGTACGKQYAPEPVAGTQAEVKVETTTEAATEAVAEAVTEAATEAAAEAVYEDNFAVDAAAAEAFALQIKEAVTQKDLEALADLTGYPVYVGFADGSETPQSRDAFIALSADRIFTPEMTESVANADVSNLTASMAGFVVSAGEKPNIIFGVRDGVLRISGYNY